MPALNRVMFTMIAAFVLVCGCATAGRPLPDDAVEFLRENRESLAIEETGSRVDADLLGDADVYLLGEAHGVAANETIDFALLTYLYETAGVRTYLTESGYAVGIVSLSLLIPEEEPPAEIRGELEAIRQIVRENAWSVERCRTAAEALSESIVANRDVYAAYFGDRIAELVRIVDSLIDGFAYRAGRGREAKDARDRSMYERLIDLSDEYPGPYYGRFGAEHIYQRSYRRLQRLGSLIDGVGSPFSGRVASILIAYDGGTRLARGRDGSFEPAPLESPSRLLRPLNLVRDRDEEVTLFRLTGKASPMSGGLYLLEAPSGGGVTTDYIQYIILIADAEASTLFDTRSE